MKECMKQLTVQICKDCKNEIIDWSCDYCYTQRVLDMCE